MYVVVVRQTRAKERKRDIERDFLFFFFSFHIHTEFYVIVATSCSTCCCARSIYCFLPLSRFNFLYVCILKRHIFFLYSTKSSTYAVHVCSAYGEHIDCVVMWVWRALPKWERNVRIGQSREKNDDNGGGGSGSGDNNNNNVPRKVQRKGTKKKNTLQTERNARKATTITKIEVSGIWSKCSYTR